MVRHYADKELDISLYADPVFYNQRLVSGRVELFWYEDSSKKTVWMPIMVDKRNGEYATVTTFGERRVPTDFCGLVRGYTYRKPAFNKRS